MPNCPSTRYNNVVQKLETTQIIDLQTIIYLYLIYLII